jgi:hypothetical protein
MNGNRNLAELSVFAPRHKKNVKTLTQYFPFDLVRIELTAAGSPPEVALDDQPSTPEPKLVPPAERS